DRADYFLERQPVCYSPIRVRRRRPRLEQCTRIGIDRRGIVTVLLVQLEYVAAVEPSEVLPPCHIFIILPHAPAPSGRDSDRRCRDSWRGSLRGIGRCARSPHSA